MEPGLKFNLLATERELESNTISHKIRSHLLISISLKKPKKILLSAHKNLFYLIFKNINLNIFKIIF